MGLPTGVMTPLEVEVEGVPAAASPSTEVGRDGARLPVGLPGRSPARGAPQSRHH